MIDERFLGYVNSFRKWSEAQVSKFLIIEKRFAEEDMKFTGQLDFVVKGTDNELYLVDLKTSAKPQKTHPIQMAAYDRLLKRHGVVVKSAMLVYLDKDGEFPEIQVVESMYNEFRVFESALECWNYFNKKKEKKND